MPEMTREEKRRERRAAAEETAREAASGAKPREPHKQKMSVKYDPDNPLRLVIKDVKANYVYLRGSSKDPARCNMEIVVDLDAEGGADVAEALDAAVDHLVKTGKWKGKNGPKASMLPIKDGEDHNDDTYAGTVYFNAAGRKGVADPENGGMYFATPVFSKKPDPGTRKPYPIQKNHPEFPASGDYVNVTLTVWAQDQNSKQAAEYGERINITLEAVQLSAKGIPVGNAPSVDTLASEFEADVDDADL